jgi:hypothetical protein
MAVYLLGLGDISALFGCSEDKSRSGLGRTWARARSIKHQPSVDSLFICLSY